MEKDGEMIGHVMYAHSHIKSYDGKTIPIMTFGPISIAPEYKGQGYGTRLLRYSMQKAKEMEDFYNFITSKEWKEWPISTDSER